LSLYRGRIAKSVIRDAVPTFRSRRIEDMVNNEVCRSPETVPFEKNEQPQEWRDRARDVVELIVRETDTDLVVSDYLMDEIAAKLRSGAAQIPDAMRIRARIKRIDDLLHDKDSEAAHAELHELAHEFEILMSGFAQTPVGQLVRDALDSAWCALADGGIQTTVFTTDAMRKIEKANAALTPGNGAVEAVLKLVEEAWKDGQSQYLWADGGLDWEAKRQMYEESVLALIGQPASKGEPVTVEALKHALARFECLAEQFEETGDTASWVMCSVDADRMRRALNPVTSTDRADEEEVLENVRNATIEECAEIAEKLHEDSRWSPHYQNASLAIAPSVPSVAERSKR
jgi:hypothetical protein